MTSTAPLTTPPAMPPDRGVCTHLPEACGLAARRQPQPLTDGAGRCSECGSALMLPAAPAAAASPAAARRWLLPVLALLLVLAALVGWLLQRGASSRAAPAEPSPPLAAAGASAPLLRLHGSNTVGAALAPALVKAFLTREGYTEQSATPTAPEELRIEARRPSDGARLAVALASHGTSTAFSSLAAGQAELGMASRPIQAKEREATKALGDLSAEGSEYIVALDGVAVIVHPSNPLKQLTLAQLRDLFTGRTGDWSALGAPAGAVRLHARDEKSGTWDTFRALVLDKQALAAGTTRHEDSRALAAAVAADPMAIGFVGLPYAEAAKTLALARAKLMLLGFSDDRGDRCANIGLSQQRARAVAADLSTYGVRPAVVQGYGPAAAVASNDTEAGRERNRRVEVWLLDKPPATPVQPFACGQAALSTR